MGNSKRVAMFIVVGIPAVCCLGGVLLLLYSTSRAAASEREALSEAQKVGLPVTFDDLHMKAVPKNRNAAVIYLQARELLEGPLKRAQTDMTDWSRSVSPTSDGRAKAKEAADLAYPKLKPVYDLLDQLDGRDGCSFNRQWNLGPSLEFPELQNMKDFVRDLSYRASLQDENGDRAGALTSMRRAYHVAVDSGSDPVLIGMLVQVACNSLLVTEWRKLVASHADDANFLARAAALVAPMRQMPNERFYFGGDVALERVSLASLKSFADLGGNMPSESDEGPRKPSPLESKLFQSRLAQSTFDAKLLQAWTGCWRKMPADPTDWDGTGQALEAMVHAVEQDKSWANQVNRILMPVFSEATKAVGRLQARTRLLVCSIALLRIRAATGSLPETLPASLGADGIDPFDGNPLRYRRQDKGFVIYSIGADRVDNGGRKRQANDPPGTEFDEVMEFE